MRGALVALLVLACRMRGRADDSTSEVVTLDSGIALLQETLLLTSTYLRVAQRLHA